MSSATYPQGMKSYNNHVNQGGYVTWKGSGNQSNPVGITATNIRPLTNNDPGNVFPTGFGLARPMKHYRKGRVIPVNQMYNPGLLQGEGEDYTFTSNNKNFTITPASEAALIERNMNRAVRSSYGASLGGGAGGISLVSQTIAQPGSYSIKANPANEFGEESQQALDCKICNGITLVSSFAPHNSYLTENPNAQTQTPAFCCNEERKARRRVVYASTNLKKNYYTTLQQYRQNRCQTYDQRIFNFVRTDGTALFESNAAEEIWGIMIKGTDKGSEHGFDEAAIRSAKPGSPLALINTYVANCQPNGEISAAAEYNFLDSLMYYMWTRSIVSEQNYINFLQQQVVTIKQFLAFVNASMPPKQKEQVVETYNQCLTNPAFSDFLSSQGSMNLLGCKAVVYKPSNYQYATQGAVSSSTRILKQNVTTIENNLANINRDQKRGALLGLGPALNKSGEPLTPYLYKNKVQGCNQQIQIRYQNHNSCTKAANAHPTQPARPSNHYAQSPRNALM